ncbi:MAG: putative metal-binding motif-containing protein [Deltaproteobacteria bacterium]|nr:putative metal-binding motif-containing protein [Deltaproteobacteria bacterium]
MKIRLFAILTCGLFFTAACGTSELSGGDITFDTGMNKVDTENDSEDTDTGSEIDFDTDGGTGSDSGSCSSETLRCFGDNIQTCIKGVWTDWSECTVQGLTCSMIQGVPTCSIMVDTDSGTFIDSEVYIDTDLGILFIDDDSDGFNDVLDCDDSDKTIHPAAYDIPEDGIDQDCDGADAVISDTDTGSK